MDKITIIPGSVRGYGDVVSPKTIEDFEVFDSELSFEDGLYTLVYDASGVSVGLSVSSGTISVGGSVVLTAEVLSAGEPAVGETVSFYDGTTLLGTDETDSDGIATYTASSLGVGSHSLTASALDKSSSAVSVTVNKLTSTITLSVPSTGTVGTSYTVSGTLVPTTGSVKLYENGSLKDTLTVSSGSFSKAITQSNEGTYSYYAVFEGSSTYSSVTSSTGSIVVSDVPPVPVVTSVSLTGDKSILSYADSESATLSATVLDSNDDPMSGVTVEFFKGSTSLGTATTNSSGVATKSYASSGVGDVSFTASVGTISSETCDLTDARYYNDGSRVTGMQGTSGASITTDGEYISLTATNSGEKQIGYGISYASSDNWEISCIIDYANSVGHAYSFVLSSSSSLGGSNNYLSLDIPSSSLYVKLDGGSARTYPRTFATGDKITIRRLNGYWILLHNDDEVWNGSYSWSGNRMICHYVTSARTIKIKDIVIKPL